MNDGTKDERGQHRGRKFRGKRLPELVRQSEDYAVALLTAGRPVRKLLVPKVNHFTILEEIAKPSGSLAMEAARLAEM